MSTIPIGVIPEGTTVSWLDAHKIATERRLVLSTSATGHQTVITVRPKVLKKTSSRPFDVLQVTAAMSHPLDAGTDGWIDDNMSYTLSMPLVQVASAAYSVRLHTLIKSLMNYFVGGMSDADATAINGVLSDNIADQLTLGLF